LVAAATHPASVDVAVGVLHGDAIDRLVVAGRQEEGALAVAAMLALDDAVAVAAGPLVEQPVRTPVHPHDIDDDEDGDAKNEEGKDEGYCES